MNHRTALILCALGMAFSALQLVILAVRITRPFGAGA